MLSNVFAQSKRPSCWKYIKDESNYIDEIYFPYEGNCQYYWQCTRHGAMRMKCPPQQHFDVDTNQCGRAADVEC